MGPDGALLQRGDRAVDIEGPGGRVTELACT